ncbi:MAG: GAF domain-containing protein [Candidatus Kapabacteria bacterium]|nr:GAF domain-containing protein [Candidatus Kapabacteria bacterium]
MFTIPQADSDPSVLRSSILQTVDNVTHGETDLIANCANVASVLYHMLADVNWAGFYLYKQDELVLGPFHGKPACIRIALGRGVCGTAARQRRTVVVPDVEAFPGHIACDSASRSEVVVPMLRDGVLIGVLDVDSPVPDRFSTDDVALLESIACLIMSR